MWKSGTSIFYKHVCSPINDKKEYNRYIKIHKDTLERKGKTSNGNRKNCW